MKLEIKNIPAKLAPVLRMLRSYIAVIFIVVIGLMYAFLILRVNQLAQSEPGDDAVAERLETTTRPKIDEESAAKLEALEDQNVQVQTLFNQARNNPFSE
jgi:hypothetical protein